MQACLIVYLVMISAQQCGSYNYKLVNIQMVKDIPDKLTLSFLDEE